MTKHKLEQNCQQINKSQCSNTSWSLDVLLEISSVSWSWFMSYWLSKSVIDSDFEEFNINSYSMSFNSSKIFKLLIFFLTLQSFLKCYTFPYLKHTRLEYEKVLIFLLGFLFILLWMCKIRFIDDNYTCPPIVDFSMGLRHNAIVW